jgi:hypothetical protein
MEDGKKNKQRASIAGPPDSKNLFDNGALRCTANTTHLHGKNPNY